MINFYSASSVFLPFISFLKTNWTRFPNSTEPNRKENHHYDPPKNTLYQLIIWDFGDTLNRLREGALAEGAAEIEQELGCHVNAGMLREAIRQEWRKRSDESSLNIIKSIDTIEKEDDYYREFYLCVAGTFSDKLPGKTLLDSLVRMQVNPESYELMPGAKDVLEKLKEKGIRQAILSNGFVSARKQIKHLKIDHYFDCIMVSCEEHAAKPDQALYQRLLDFCKINTPQETLFIDDRREFIEGAAQMKMDTLWFQPQNINENGSIKERISNLSEVFDKVVAKEQEHDRSFQPHCSSSRRAYS